MFAYSAEGDLLAEQVGTTVTRYEYAENHALSARIDGSKVTSYGRDPEGKLVSVRNAPGKPA